MHPLFIALPELADDLSQFEQKLSSFTQQLGLNLSELTLDHISLRCHQDRTAERWATALSQHGRCFSEAVIGGRPIHLYRLVEPLVLLNHSIAIVELPWPGEKRYRHEGWEHVEVVLAGAPEEIGQRAMALIDDRGLVMPGISVKTRRPEAKAGALDNTTLAVTNGEITLKFHTYPIDEVVASEQ
ncbi:VOC family protein [Rosenbergiella nectarea]|uniref:VOC family protein n=1 Tax=Rosenbergiella nectarea TaxID=988801 RepID=UPI001BDB1758|nr:VOC family protein [Rosenbergiella nectarea]MBT0729450.1 VOC family protein [Rosenbergiella nectarea subsp. apis]